jgi:hypothetical protein
MGAFASWIRELFQQLIGAFVQREVSRGVAVTAAFAGFLALIASLASALFLAMQTALQAIVWNIQTPELQTFIGVFWPHTIRLAFRSSCPLVRLAGSTIVLCLQPKHIGKL